jgi:glucose/arabinose dehydrogenase
LEKIIISPARAFVFPSAREEIENVDSDSHRSRICRLNISSGLFPFNFQDAESFADGLSNEVGLAFDKHGVLWGVENGAENKLKRSDPGGDIHDDKVERS